MASLECPVCRSAMREIEREGVQIDTCPQCRGVWLDRGELEKLAERLGSTGERRREASTDVRPAVTSALRDEDFNGDRIRRSARRDGRRDDDDDDDDAVYERSRDERGRTPARKSRFGGLLDFFD